MADQGWGKPEPEKTGPFTKPAALATPEKPHDPVPLGVPQTSTGEATLGTVGNAPKQVPDKTNDGKFHTPKGWKFLSEIKDLLTKGHLTKGMLGDDALKALGTEKE